MPIRSFYGKRSKDREARELKQHMNIPATAGGGGVTDHGALTGLADDDHANYVHITAARSIQAQHTYSPVSPAAPFVLAANAQGQLVTGFKADQLDKQVIAGDGLITGGTLTSDVTLAVASANTGIGVNADNIALTLGTNPGLEISLGLKVLLETTSGLALSGTGLGVGAGDGINVLANTIEVDVTDLIATGLVEVATNNIGHGTGDFGDMHTNYAEHDQAETITGVWTWSIDLLPTATDTYDIGSSTKLWRKGYLSELEALLFVTNSIRVEGGWLIIGHDAGTIAADVTAITDDDVDFGKAMAVGDFVLFRGILQVEYMQVGTLVSGTRYNVTRNLDGSGENNWPAGMVFLVLGTTGDGRIELVADQGDSPRFSVVEQGATYNAQTEVVRIGNMRNSYGIGANDYWGLGVGDYDLGNYMKYDDTSGFVVSAGDGHVGINEDGIQIEGASDELSFLLDGTIVGYLGHITGGQVVTEDVNTIRLWRGTVSAERMVNGNFETDITTGWTESGDYMFSDHSSTRARKGLYSLKLWETSEGPIQTGYYETTDYMTINGNQARFSYHVYSVAFGYLMTAYIEWYDSSSVLVGTPIYYPFPLYTDRWDFVEIYEDKPATAVKCKVGFRNTSFTPYEASEHYIDDVQVWDVVTNKASIDLEAETVTPWDAYITMEATGIRLLSEDVRFEYDSSTYTTFETNSSGQMTITPSGGLLRLAGTSPIFRMSSGASTFDLTEVAGVLRLSGSANTGVNVLNGLYVGGTTAPTDNDITADGDIWAKTGLFVGSGSGAPGGTGEGFFGANLRVSGAIHIGGTATPSFPLHIIDTTTQIRIDYNGSNYCNFTVANNGNLTISTVGVGNTGVNITKGLRVGDTTAPADNNVYATGAVIAAGDMFAGGGLTVGTLAISPADDELNVVDRIFVGAATQAANTKLAQGIHIYQNVDTHALAFQRSGVAHGITTLADTATYGYLSDWSGSGGLRIAGLAGSGQVRGLSLHGYTNTQHTTQTTSTVGVVNISAADQSGTGVTDLGSGGAVLTVQNNTTTIAIFTGLGRLYLEDSSIYAIADEYDDVALLHGYRASMFDVKTEFYKRNQEFVKYARPILEGLDIVRYNDGPGGDGVPFTDIKGLQDLTIDAVRQLGDRMARYEKALIGLGYDPKKLH